MSLAVSVCSGLTDEHRKYTAQDPLPEELIWHIFKCLALALTVIENGNEALDGDSWDRELVHFDIKPANGKKIQVLYA
jgi:hypothetical protein